MSTAILVKKYSTKPSEVLLTIDVSSNRQTRSYIGVTVLQCLPLKIVCACFPFLVFDIFVDRSSDLENGIYQRSCCVTTIFLILTCFPVNKHNNYVWHRMFVHDVFVSKFIVGWLQWQSSAVMKRNACISVEMLWDCSQKEHAKLLAR